MSRVKLVGVSIAVVILAILGIFWAKASRSQAVIELFFPSSSVPLSMRLVAHGSERSVFGDGSSVAVFTVPESAFVSLMNSTGFSKIEIDSDTNHWRLELCNEVIAYNLKQNITITPEFACFSKDSPEKRQRTRFFYDRKQQLAIGITFVSSKRGPG
jgi:hypothetical protein